ncbi:hypothetical protein ACE1CI_05190 [Aerosakkonemataceae cyanobacterium BLCC-F50]|uniref:Uncharacterized protein n=1 Tax=Floridaenema flaviceps BLCC-F50 TaxID=3153642 RepID=A0ABV4XM38_9CYAN
MSTVKGWKKLFRGHKAIDTIKSLNKIQQPFLIACAGFAVLASFQSPAVTIVVLMGSLVTVLGELMGQKRSPRWTVALQVLVGIVSITMLLLYSATPAEAAFFQKAEEFFKSNFAQGVQGADTAVSLVFNVLRAIFLLYVAVALIGIHNAFQQGLEFQSATRTLVLVIVVAVIADVLTGVIVGNGSGS